MKFDDIFKNHFENNTKKIRDNYRNIINKIQQIDYKNIDHENNYNFPKERNHYYAMLELGNYIRIEPSVFRSCERDNCLIIHTKLIFDNDNIIEHYYIVCAGKKGSISEKQAMMIADNFMNAMVEANDIKIVGEDD